MQNGSKVVCGSDEGVIDIFNWGEWGNMSDRFPGHPMSIDTIIPITESIVCTGASDGIVRLVNTQLEIMFARLLYTIRSLVQSNVVKAINWLEVFVLLYI